MSDERTLDVGLGDRIRADAAPMAERLQARAAGPQRARRRGTRRRRAARAALAVCTVLLVVAVGVTARELARDPVPIDQRPVDTTPTTEAVDVVGTTSTLAPPATTIPPVTVTPDPSGAGAMPLQWEEVPGDVAGLGITGTDANGVTFSLFDAGAAEPSGGGQPRVSMTVARTTDGEAWERIADVPWASDLVAAGNAVLLAGQSPEGSTAPLKVRLAGSDDGGRSWDEQDVDLGEGGEAPVLNPIPVGMLTPRLPLGPDPAASLPAYGLDSIRGPWQVGSDQLSAPRLVSGPAGVLATVEMRRAEDATAAPRCSGLRQASSVYRMAYRDGVVIELRPETGRWPPLYNATVVSGSAPEPDDLVRCTVGIDSADSQTAAVKTVTVVLRRDGDRWIRSDSDLPDGLRWQLIAMGDGFIAEGFAADGGVQQLRSTDGEQWDVFERPRNWPAYFGNAAHVTDGARAIGLDSALGHVATSLDGGSTWTRVDIRQLPVPDGPVSPTSLSLSEVRASATGFVLRYIAAEGDRFWRVLATSRDGRTWATMEESVFWTGMIGPQLQLVGDRVLLTSNDSAQIASNPLVIGYTTRSYLGRPAG